VKNPLDMEGYKKEARVIEMNKVEMENPQNIEQQILNKVEDLGDFSKSQNINQVHEEEKSGKKPIIIKKANAPLTRIADSC